MNSSNDHRAPSNDQDTFAEEQLQELAEAMESEHAEPMADPIILIEQLDSLPTLNSVAVRVLQLTADDASSADDVSQLINADPAIAGRVLRVCRCSPRGRTANVTTIDRAVVLLGFDTVRAAVLSFDVVETFRSLTQRTPALHRESGFSLNDYWRHALTVATLARDLAEELNQPRDVSPGEAFLAGLLHELGLLALHVVAPDTLEDARAESESSGRSFNVICRRKLGLDAPSAGRQLARTWKLPESYANAIWLHNQHPNAVPDDAHAMLVKIVGLSNALAQLQGLPTLAGLRDEDPAGITIRAQDLGLDTERIEGCTGNLAARVDELAEALGLDCPVATHDVIAALGHANAALGRLNGDLRAHAENAANQSVVIGATRRFLEDSTEADHSVEAALRRIVRIAAQEDRNVRASMHQVDDGKPWNLSVFDLRAQIIASRALNSSTRLIQPEECALTARAMALLPHVAAAIRMKNPERLQAVPLGYRGRVQTVLFIEDDDPTSGESSRNPVHPLIRAGWDAAIQAASRQEQANRSGEKLAAANLALAEAQDEIAQKAMLASLGEVAAGAAHEMNNPLTVISGRAQLLELRLAGSDLESVAALISSAAAELSDMVTALREFAVQTPIQAAPTNVFSLCEQLVIRLRNEHPGGRRLDIQLLVPQSLPRMAMDGPKIAEALWEVMKNAAEAPDTTTLTIDAQIESGSDRLRIDVRDDGGGLTDHVLTHAFDPFFSAKPAGRQPGLGLARARRIVEAHHGRMTLQNGPSGGATVSLWLSNGISSRDETGAEDPIDQGSWSEHRRKAQ